MSYLEYGSGGNWGLDVSKKAAVMLRVTVGPIMQSHVYLQSTDLRAQFVVAKCCDISHGTGFL